MQSDSGLYRISCCNDDGEEGGEILELEVLPNDDDSPLPGHSQQQQQPIGMV